MRGLHLLVRANTGITIGIVVGVCLILSVLLDNVRTGIVTGLVACSFAALAFALINIGRPENDRDHTPK